MVFTIPFFSGNANQVKKFLCKTLVLRNVFSLEKDRNRDQSVASNLYSCLVGIHLNHNEITIYSNDDL